MMMKTLGFAPLRTVKTHDFIRRKHKLQFAPYQPAFAVDGQELIERNEVFVAFTGDLYSRVEEDNLVVRVLRQAFAH